MPSQKSPSPATTPDLDLDVDLGQSGPSGVTTPAGFSHASQGLSILGGVQGAQTLFDGDQSVRDRINGGLGVASAIGDTPILSEAGKRWLPGLGVASGVLGATDGSKSTEDRIDSGVGGTLSGVSLVAPRLSPHVAAAQAGWFVGGKISDAADSDYARMNGGVFGQDQYSGENRSLTDAYLDLLVDQQLKRQDDPFIENAGSAIAGQAERLPFVGDWLGDGIRSTANGADAAHDWGVGAQSAVAAGIGGIPTQLVDFGTAATAWSDEKVGQGVDLANDTIDVASNPAVHQVVDHMADRAGDKAESTINRAGDMAGAVADHLPGGKITGTAVRMGSRGLGAAADKGAELIGGGVNNLGRGLGAVREGWRSLFD